jgi:hypothetical protein
MRQGMIQTAEIEFLLGTAGYRLTGHQRNTEIKNCKIMLAVFAKNGRLSDT